MLIMFPFQVEPDPKLKEENWLFCSSYWGLNEAIITSYFFLPSVTNDASAKTCQKTTTCHSLRGFGVPWSVYFCLVSSGIITLERFLRLKMRQNKVFVATVFSWNARDSLWWDHRYIEAISSLVIAKNFLRGQYRIFVGGRDGISPWGSPLACVDTQKAEFHKRLTTAREECSPVRFLIPWTFCKVVQDITIFTRAFLL